jgi:hypothetical protein
LKRSHQVYTEQPSGGEAVIDLGHKFALVRLHQINVLLCYRMIGAQLAVPG